MKQTTLLLCCFGCVALFSWSNSVEHRMKGVFIISRWRGKHFDKKETLSGGGQKAE